MTRAMVSLAATTLAMLSAALPSCGHGSTNAPSPDRQPYTGWSIDQEELRQAVSGITAYSELSSAGQSLLGTMLGELVHPINTAGVAISTLNPNRVFGTWDKETRQYLAITQLFADGAAQLVQGPLQPISPIPLNYTIETSMGPVLLVDDLIYMAADPFRTRWVNAQVVAGWHLQNVPADVGPLMVCMQTIGGLVSAYCREYAEVVLGRSLVE